MTPELERYLKAATRGLWGKKKLEVREELEAHILERAHKHELLGLEHQKALSNAIQELGNARIINHKMTEVYTMPTIRVGFLVSALFVGAMTMLLSSSIAQVSVSAILGQDNTVFRLFLNADSFASNLREAGFRVEQSKQGFELVLNDKRAYIPWTKFNSRAVQGQRELDIYNAFGALQRAGIRIEQVNNLEKLSFRINGKDMTLNANSEIARAWNLMNARCWAFSYLVTRQNPIGGALQALESKAPLNAFLEGKRPDLAGKIITVIAFRQEPGKTSLLQYSAIQQVEADGYFQVSLPDGTYVMATPDKTGFQKRNGNFEIARGNKGVLIVGVRQPDWVISSPQSHRFVKFNNDVITLKPGQWTHLK